MAKQISKYFYHPPFCWSCLLFNGNRLVLHCFGFLFFIHIFYLLGGFHWKKPRENSLQQIVQNCSIPQSFMKLHESSMTGQQKFNSISLSMRKKINQLLEKLKKTVVTFCLNFVTFINTYLDKDIILFSSGLSLC